MKNYNMVTAEKEKIYKHYHLEKLINMNILRKSEEILPCNQRHIKEQAKFSFSPLKNSFENIEHVGAIKSLDISNKKYELRQTEHIFVQHLINDLILAKLKELIKLQDIIKKRWSKL